VSTVTGEASPPRGRFAALSALWVRVRAGLVARWPGLRLPRPPFPNSARPSAVRVWTWTLSGCTEIARATGRAWVGWARSHRLALDGIRADAADVAADDPLDGDPASEWAPWSRLRAAAGSLLGVAWRHVQIPVLGAGGVALGALVSWALLEPLWPLAWIGAAGTVAAAWRLAPRGPERTVGLPLLTSGALAVAATWAWGLAGPVPALWGLVALLWCVLWLAYGPILAHARTAAQAAPVAATAAAVEAATSPAGLSMPPLGLLAEGAAPATRDAELRAGERAIEERLAAFELAAQVTAHEEGPNVVLYVVEMDGAVGLAKVEARRKDLQLALGADTIRVVAPIPGRPPIPGRSEIGIEVPARERQSVALRAVLEAPEGREPRALPLALGWGRGAVLADLAAMPHLLIAGATGSGKSVCVNAVLCSLLLQLGPERLRLGLIDPKRVELKPYNRLPHLVRPVAVELDEATELLRYAAAQVRSRLLLLEDADVKDIAAYNARLGPAEALPFLVIVVDELADLMVASRLEAKAESRAGCEVDDLIDEIGRLGRAAGVHLVLATQRPTVDVVTGRIKANVPARIAFSVSSRTDSGVVLDEVGAEKLLGRGDMLYRPTGGRLVRLQGAYLSDDEVGAVVRHWTGRPHGADDRDDDGPATFDELMRGLLAGGEPVKIDDLVAAAASAPLGVRAKRSKVYEWLRANAEGAGPGWWRSRPEPESEPEP
jgi:FtsK/SpoIIIE family/FtsK alpha domain